MKKAVKIALGVIGGLFILAIIGGSSGVSNTTTETKTETSPPVNTPAQPSNPKTWQKAYEVSGRGKKRTESFMLTGGDARIRYSLDGSQSTALYVYVMKDGQNFEEDGGIPEVMADQPESSETRLVKATGKYYLEINSANCNWTVVIEELK